MKPITTILVLILMATSAFAQSWTVETDNKFKSKQDTNANLSQWSNVGTNQFLGTNTLPALTNQFLTTNGNGFGLMNLNATNLVGSLTNNTTGSTTTAGTATNAAAGGNIVTNSQPSVTFGTVTSTNFVGNGGGLTNVTGTGGATNAIANLNGFGTNTTLISYLTNAPTYTTNATNFGRSSYFTNATYVTNWTSATNVTQSNNTNQLFTTSAGTAAVNGNYLSLGVDGYNNLVYSNSTSSGFASCYYVLTNGIGIFYTYNGGYGYQPTARYSTLTSNSFPSGIWTNQDSIYSVNGTLPEPTVYYGTNYATNYVLETIICNIITNFSPTNGGTFIGTFAGNGSGLTNLNVTGSGITNLLATNATLPSVSGLVGFIPTNSASGSSVTTNQFASTNYVIAATNNLGNTVSVAMTNVANQFVGMLNWGYGNGNFFVGGAGNTNMSGTQNIGIGDFALYFNSSGSQNVAFGYEALVYNTIGQNNLAAGRYALFANTNGNNNTAVGAFALENNTCGSDNLAVGQTSLGLNTSGSNNVAIGSLAGVANNPTASGNVDIASLGNSSDVNIIRIGDAQTDAYIAGIIHCNGGGLTNIAAIKVATNASPPAVVAGYGYFWPSNYDLYWVTPLKTNLIILGH